MGKKRIRPTAICVLRRGDELLVYEGYEPVRQFGYARPLGGGIDLGETSAAAVVREIREELGAEITDIALLGTTSVSAIGRLATIAVAVGSPHFTSQLGWMPRKRMSPART